MKTVKTMKDFEEVCSDKNFLWFTMFTVGKKGKRKKKEEKWAGAWYLYVSKGH